MAATILKQNNAEIGLTNGTSVNVGNSGGGGQDALGSSSIGAGNTFVVSSASPLEGTYSFLLTQTGANPCDQYWALATTYADFSWQFRFSYNQAPAVNCNFARGLTSTTFTGAAYTLTLRTDNKLSILDNVGSATVTSTGTLTPGTAYLMQGRSNGTNVTVNVYPVGSTTATATLSLTYAAASIGSFKLGINTGSALIVLKYDSVKFATGGFIGRTDVSNTAPTASVGPAQYVVAGSTVNLTGTDADVDGTVDSRAWTWDTTDTTGPAGTTRHWLTGPTITGATTQNASAVMATPGCYRAKYIVTDDGGLPSTAVYTNIFVYPASGVAVTVRDELRGTWTAVGAGGLNDANDATGSRSPDDPTGQSDTLLMNPHGPGRSTGAITFVWRGNSTGGTIHRTVEWYKADGTTLIDSRTADAPTSIGDQTFTMSGTGLAAIPTTADSAEMVVRCKSAI
jgi:hypothetical protein